jgi:hypothetical protein
MVRGPLSIKLIQKEIEKWKKHPPSVLTYAMWTHIERHEDKDERYTIAIMRKTDEHKANQGIIRLKNKANQGENNATNNSVFGGYPSEIGKNERHLRAQDTMNSSLTSLQINLTA